MVLIPLILNYGINTNAMEIARFALMISKQNAGVQLNSTGI